MLFRSQNKAASKEEKNGQNAESTEEEHSSRKAGRQQRRYHRAQKRVEAAGRQVEKAKAGLPVRRHLRLRYYREHYGKFRYRLRFEEEEIPEGRKQTLAQTAEIMAGRAASMKAHQKIREVEKENVGVEAGHKAESATEFGMARQAGRMQRRLAAESYRRLDRAQKRLREREAELAYRRLLNEHPELQKKVLARWMQKRKLKRKYARAAREAAGELKRRANVLASVGGKVRSLARQAAGRKSFLFIAAAGILILDRKSVV